MNKFNIIETKRLILREFIESDIQKVHEYASDQDVSKYVPWGPNTLKQTEEFVKMRIKYQHQKERVDFELAVIDKSDGELIGACGLHIPELYAVLEDEYNQL
jgi:RimJ/RimL family protein N-acetyltransferase